MNRRIWILSFMLCLTFLSSAHAQQEVLINGSFETGHFNPWYWGGTYWWNIYPGGPSGSYYAHCQFSAGSWIRQEFAPTPTNDVISVTLWLSGDYGALDVPTGITFYYQGGGSSLTVIGIGETWRPFNVTYALTPNAILTGIKITGGGDISFEPWTSVDGVSILANIAPPSVSITLTPVNPPVIIPVNGGFFDFNLALVNTGGSSATFDVWTGLYTPTGLWMGPIFYVRGVQMASGATLNRIRTQYIPAFAPAGEYHYYGFAGNYPTAPWDSSSFSFTKLASGDGPLVSDWFCTGETFSVEIGGTHSVSPQPPSIYGLSCSPNPFNPSTVASLELRDASYVSLRVYDTAGRLTATLVNGWRQAGSHEVTFDGTGLPSGVYLLRLEAGNYAAVQKLILLK